VWAGTRAGTRRRSSWRSRGPGQQRTRAGRAGTARTSSATALLSECRSPHLPHTHTHTDARRFHDDDNNNNNNNNNNYKAFNGLFSRTTWISRHQKGKTSLDFNEARHDGVLGWQWHQLDHMQTICTSFQTDNHTNTPSLNFYGPDALPGAQLTTQSKH